MSGDEDSGSSGSEEKVRQGSGRWNALLRETAIVLILSLVIATFIRLFVAQAFLIPSSSMEETLQIRDRVLVSKLNYRFGDISRGDVVVFKDPGGWLHGVEPDSGGVRSFFEFVGIVPDSAEGHLIKRVIGVAGDEVDCCDAAGRVTVNGIPVDESDYIYPADAASYEFSEGSVRVPDGEVFVMGDHRSNSRDSRVVGTVAEDLVVGRAVVVVWPISRWDILARPASAFDAITS